MFSEKVYTIEEISQHLRVPEEAVLQEVSSGRLRALRLGEYLRVRESDLNAYLDTSLEVVDPKAVGAPTSATEGKKHASPVLLPALPFAHTWPDKTTEQFNEVSEGVVSDGGRERHVKIGFTFRKTAGKRRRRSLVLVDRYPSVEFVAADDGPKGRMASIIRGRDGKQLPTGATLPPEYKNLNVGSYGDVVRGPYASSGVAVICDSQDLATMTKHALIRYRFREERA
jgi:excisionase family DNA binding protein